MFLTVRIPPQKLFIAAGLAGGLAVGGAATVRAAAPVAAATPGSEPASRVKTLEVRSARRYQPIYRTPDGRGPLRGTMVPGESFEVVAQVAGPRCSGGVWGELPAGGYTCLGTTELSEETPVFQPRLAAFDQPRPEEYFSYLETGAYDRDRVDVAEPILPFIYGKRWRGWRAPAWDSLAAWNAGRASTHNLEGVPKYHFVEAIDTPRGQVLRRRDGVVVPADRVFIYPVDRFQGRDLEARPVPEGRAAAWVVAYDGVSVRSEPHAGAPIMASLDYHQELTVDAVPVASSEDEALRWWRIPDAVVPGVDGWVPAGTEGIRVLQSLARPEEVGPDEIWVDVDRTEQVLSLRRGNQVLYATLVSTGDGARWATPKGLYRVYDKSVYGDMKSRDDADEPYHVEKVPWVMHFKHRYALHGVFWHWGFGHPASHGCVNLAPRDAHYLFERIGPRIGKGWHTAYATPEDPGTHMRVHDGRLEVPDKRVAAR
ncbi:MAG: hypothetical protein CL927_08000 [Deltaproteobacteria bacterium]|nr:hypothetical protein [Deltaproteobacteria bacterium]